MQAVRIYDFRPTGVLAFDLRDVLEAIGPRATASVWSVNPVASANEAVMIVGGDGQFEELAASRARVDGDRFVHILKSVRQIIWGEFHGFTNAAATVPWIVVVAFDSSYFEVRTNDNACLACLRARFTDVRVA